MDETGDQENHVFLDADRYKTIPHLSTNYCWLYITLYVNPKMCSCHVTASAGVLPREVRFDSAGPVFYEIRDVVHLPRLMMRFVSKTRNP